MSTRAASKRALAAISDSLATTTPKRLKESAQSDVSDVEEDLKATPKKPAAKSSKQSSKPRAKKVAEPNPTPYSQGVVVDAPLTVRMPLTWDFEAAKAHLISCDARFAPLFANIKVKPYQDLDEQSLHVNPWRALVTSILGQQVSWLAARAITWKFCRLYFDHLPEKRPDDARDLDDFPTPMQVAKTELTRLRTAGLSQRKAEYIQGLAEYFVDGRLTAEKLVAMSDEEVMRELVAVRGIGRWTVEMFSMFVLKRPDILSPGDLGLQKNLVRWFTLEEPAVSVRKLADNAPARAATPSPDDAILTPPATPANRDAAVKEELKTPSGAPLTHLPPPTPASPGIPFPASSSLTPAQLRGRLTTKVKKVYLNQTEMEELTESWRPYRSCGLWLMWSLSDGPDSSV